MLTTSMTYHRRFSTIFLLFAAAVEGLSRQPLPVATQQQDSLADELRVDAQLRDVTMMLTEDVQDIADLLRADGEVRATQTQLLAEPQMLQYGSLSEQYNQLPEQYEQLPEQYSAPLPEQYSDPHPAPFQAFHTTSSDLSWPSDTYSSGLIQKQQLSSATGAEPQAKVLAAAPVTADAAAATKSHTTDDDDDKGLKRLPLVKSVGLIPAIIIMVVAAIFVIIILVVLCVCCYRRIPAGYDCCGLLGKQEDDNQPDVDEMHEVWVRQDEDKQRK